MFGSNCNISVYIVSSYGIFGSDEVADRYQVTLNPLPFTVKPV